MNSDTLWIVLLLVLGHLICSCSSPKDSLLFSSSRNGNSDIFYWTEGQQDITQVTFSTYDEWAPVWVDPQTISYLRQEDSGIKRIVQNLDSGTSAEIDHPKPCRLDDKNAMYNPSNKNTLFGCNGELYIQNALNSQYDILTYDITAYASYPEWVNDSTITFTVRKDGNNEIAIMNLRRKSVSYITNSNSNDERSTVSPDGKFILYSSDLRQPGNQDLMLMNLETSEITAIVQSPGNELIGRWNSTGDKIYFGSDMNGNWEIYSLEIHTNKTTQLTNHRSFDGDPRLKPKN